ncbi:Fe-only nitrogenase subunit delta [uncultured Desulfobacter sp.]|uniref:Fe-only nitrogenase subunit delta n=1 Tax=uncultured Desulfobacter sp. TaxID=240139 RepID=UPI002AAB743D|nr:Fe-only nitrogenase subunit delta [uncultured Desulfobacter sp.]
MNAELMKERVEKLVNVIMKNCLWQYHSRAWDRRDQNHGVLTKATQILCGEHVELETPADRCYWVDAVWLADDYRKRFDWMLNLDKNNIKILMKALHERMDYLMIDGSLNLELTDEHY